MGTSVIYAVSTAAEDFIEIFRWLDLRGIPLEPIRGRENQLCFGIDDDDPEFTQFLLKYSSSLTRLPSAV